MKKIFYLLGLLLWAAQMQLSATHVAGGDISYRYIGDSSGIANHYEVLVRLSRDASQGTQSMPTQIPVLVCSNAYPSQSVTAYLIAGGPGQIANAVFNCVSPGSLNTVPIEIYSYRGIATLPGTASDFTFAFNFCCRSNSIQNLTGSGGIIFHLRARLNNMIGNNSSPKFLVDPIRTFCVNKTVNWVHPVYEADGDSLFFKLVSVKSGATGCAFNPTTYQAGYSAQQPITTTPPQSLVINPKTGTITFTPAVSQVVAVAFEVEEYRYDSTFFVWFIVGSSYWDTQIGIATNCSPTAQLGVTINDSLPSVLDPLTGLPVIDVDCLTDSIVISYNSKIDCYTIAADGSNFRFSTPNNLPLPIVSAHAVCSVTENHTRQITIKLAQPIVANGRYKLYSKVGNNGTTIGTTCGFYQNEFDTIFINVTGCSGISVNEFEREKPEIFFPNIFTPNNDGINDNFVIDITENVRGQFYLEIFNRWGQPVHRTSGTNTLSWDGTHLGKEVSTGVYYYNMKHNPSGHSWQGHITLMR